MVFYTFKKNKGYHSYKVGEQNTWVLHLTQPPALSLNQDSLLDPFGLFPHQ